MKDFFIKTKIYSGNDSLGRLSKLKNKQIYIVCDGFLVSNGGLESLLQQIDNSNNVFIFKDVVPDLPIHTVTQGVKEITKNQADVIIAFGGGSAIDTAKGIIYAAKKMNVIKDSAKFIAIPTTSGTGSEVTQVTVVSDPNLGMKQLIADEIMLPDEAILDSSFTMSVNPVLTANTGMDVFAHAIEAYVAKDANVYTDAFVEKSVELAVGSILECYSNGTNETARLDMHYASNLAGMAFNKAGLGICHSIAHAIGGRFHVPHGLANAMLLNEVIKYNCQDKDAFEKYAALAKKSGMVDNCAESNFAVEVLLQYISSIKIIMKMPFRLNEVGISKRDFDTYKIEISERALKDQCTSSNPLSIDEKAICKIIENIY